MKQVGIWLMILGFGSMVLSFLNYEFRLLMWIENWGPAIAWAIRAGVVAVGAVLFFLGWKQEGEKVAA